MADSTWGGMAEGLIAGFTVVSQARARHADIAMKRKQMKIEKHRSDMADMNYFVNMMSANVGEKMKGRAFENIKGIMKNNAEYFGIPKDYDYDKLQYDPSDKYTQDFVKQLQAINKSKDLNEADKTLAVQEALYTYDADQRKKLTSIAETYNKAMASTEKTKRTEKMQKLAMVSQHAQAANYNEETGEISFTAKPPELGFREKEDIKFAHAERLARITAGLKAEAGDDVSEREKFQAQQEKELRTLVHKNYGFERDTGFPDAETAEKARHVMVEGTRYLRSKSFVDPKTGELRKPSIAEAFQMADAGYKKSESRALLKKLPTADPGLLNNKNQTISGVRKAIKAGDLDPREIVQHLATLGWKDDDLLEIASEGHSEIGMIADKLSNQLKEDKPDSGWYNTGSLMGIEFYWDQKKGKFTNIRNTARR